MFHCNFWLEAYVFTMILFAFCESNVIFIKNIRLCDMSLQLLVANTYVFHDVIWFFSVTYDLLIKTEDLHNFLLITCASLQLCICLSWYYLLVVYQIWFMLSIYNCTICHDNCLWQTHMFCMIWFARSVAYTIFNIFILNTYAAIIYS